MRSRYRIRTPTGAYFITSTVVQWLPVFTTPGCLDILVKALHFAQKNKGLKIHAWVILDNHFHAIVSGSNCGKTIGELKRFTSNRLLLQIRSEGRVWLLNQLHFYSAAHKRASGQSHQLWQEGIHPKEISSSEMMQQKISYMHQNPLRRGWVHLPEHWRFSSAHEHFPGANPVLRCDSWQ